MIDLNHTNCIFDELYEQALQDYRQTEAHELRHKRNEQMDKSCEDMLSGGELAFIHECFEQLLEDSEARERAVYERGIRDGITILRWLGVV